MILVVPSTFRTFVSNTRRGISASGGQETGTPVLIPQSSFPTDAQSRQPAGAEGGLKVVAANRAIQVQQFAGDE